MAEGHRLKAGFTGADHVGLTVPNLEQAVAWFQRVLGAEPVAWTAPFGDAGDLMVRRFKTHPRATVKVCIMRCGMGSNIELLEWTAPEQKRQMPQTCDHGAAHVAFHVEDIHAAVRHLRAEGVEVLDEPMHIADGDLAGLWWVYFLTPWGNFMELYHYPQGMGYEARGGVRMWSPTRPAA
ncbi:MAG: VOC family protein [Alphaproteobacteria bacterium]